MEKIEVATYNRVSNLDKPKKEKKFRLEHELVVQIGIFIMALMLGRATVLSNISPFGVAFFGANLNKKSKLTNLWIALFCILGAITSGGFLYASKYALAIGILASAEVAFRISSKKNMYKSLICAVLSGAVFLLYTYFSGMLYYDMIISTVETALVFVLVYIFSVFIESISQKGVFILTNEQIISIVITFSIILIALDKVSILGLSLQNIIAMTAIMIFGYNFGGSGAAAGGAFLGLILNISNQIAPTAIGTWAFAGLAGGVLKPFKKIGVSLGFIIGWILINGYTYFDEKIIYSSIDMIISIGLFMIIPENFVTRCIDTLKPISTDKKNYEAFVSTKIVEDKLDDFSGAFKVLSEQFLNMNEDESSNSDHDRLNLMLDNVAQNVCLNCSGYTCCFKSDFYNTYKMMVNIIDSAQYNGVIYKSNIPQHFKERCLRLDNFIKELNYAFNLYRMDMLWEKKLDDTRKLMSSQLKEVAGTIKEMSNCLNLRVEIQTQLKEVIIAELNKKNINFSDLEVYTNKNKILNVEIGYKGCMGRLKCLNEILPLLKEVTGAEMVKSKESCMYDDDKGTCYLRLIEKPKYTMKFAGVSVAKNIGGICGDNFKSISVNNDRMVMVVSDGMGTGVKAFNQSKASVEAAESLLKSGFESMAASKLVNSLLLIGDGENNFATLDICTVNNYTGDVEFSKIGAAPSYIKRKNKVEYINSDSLPVGIIEDVDIKLTYKHLEEGDAVIMITDGVIDNGDGIWLKRYISDMQISNPESMAKDILEAATENLRGELSDDMSVLVGILRSGN